MTSRGLIKRGILVTYVGVDKVGTERSTALKLGVGDSNTSVDDVGSDASASSGVEDVVLATSISVRETDKARSGVGLSNEGTLGLDNSIGLDIGDLLGGKDGLDHLVVGIESHGTPVVHLEGVDLSGEEVAAEASLSEVALLDGGGELGLLGGDGLGAKGVVVDDNVAVGDDVLGVRVGDVSNQASQVFVDLVDGFGEVEVEVDVVAIGVGAMATERQGSRQGGHH